MSEETSYRNYRITSQPVQLMDSQPWQADIGELIGFDTVLLPFRKYREKPRANNKDGQGF
ncbi:hypothetical protein W02_10650 [Nitrospira sp. KM1]|nr:hypothetical protein W02_10650 [Nitrospira sp. KM1]